MLDIDLRVDVLYARLRQLHRRLVLTDGDLIVGRVDHHQQIALANGFVIHDVKLDDATRDLRRHGDYVGAHGGVARPRCPHIGSPHRPTEQPSKGDRRQHMALRIGSSQPGCSGKAGPCRPPASHARARGLDNGRESRRARDMGEELVCHGAFRNEFQRGKHGGQVQRQSSVLCWSHRQETPRSADMTKI